MLDAVKGGDKDYDIIFLDIEMPELSGMDANPLFKPPVL